MASIPTGVLGCGTISDRYFDATECFDEYEIVACADIDEELAKAKAEKYDLEPYDPEGLLDSAVEIVVNLTPPSVHAETCEQALDAGKHVYVEKPLALSLAEAQRILDKAKDAGRRVGAAPDTFLGAGLQTCRRVLDEGRIGDPIGATAVYTSSGHESWHPNPDFYYQEGGGPLLDMGPYYVTALVSLLGPVDRVTGSVTRPHDERTITSTPRHGEKISVEVPTHETGVLEFADGTVATLTTSFDVQDSTLPEPTFELYGTEGTLALPDPNHFEGPVRVSTHDSDGFEEVELTHEYTAGRGAGVADLARTIRDGEWSHRTSGNFATHVLEVLTSVRAASEQETHLTTERTPERPEPLPQTFPNESSRPSLD
ncbi:Gfo/Idh/MocA family protein [Halogranum rubrum]|uniref:Oxidoreductase domain protein n=1 Tax=Halogranum salarium B-1 TaxID=1210908 RepID=J3JDF1_9EURY|nr:Gfo/Idh/MocA family oxidoreductase [Halogranum salarium]EJN57434.1 oxidoreductase domain protein [Halogranum salarium B-1]